MFERMLTSNLWSIQFVQQAYEEHENIEVDEALDVMNTTGALIESVLSRQGCSLHQLFSSHQINPRGPRRYCASPVISQVDDEAAHGGL